MTLISDSELSALRGLAESGMQTTVYIYHGVTTVTDDGQSWGYPDSPDLTVLGWNYEMTPGGATLNEVSGEVSLIELHRLMLPVGTACASGDKVVLNSQSFIVQHTNADDTYPTSLIVLMRVQQPS